MDVEGAEKYVIEGMGNLIEKISVLHLEYMFDNYFEGQMVMEDITSITKKYGFKEPFEINTEYSEKDGSKVMCDLIFSK